MINPTIWETLLPPSWRSIRCWNRAPGCTNAEAARRVVDFKIDSETQDLVAVRSENASERRNTDEGLEKNDAGDGVRHRKPPLDLRSGAPCQAASVRNRRRVLHCTLPSQPDGPVTTRGAQYSRVLVMPGLGTGYLPSLSAFKGAGESSFRLSRPGANSCLQLSISSKVTSWPV